MSHYAPLVRFYIARPTLAPSCDGRSYPSWAMNALGGIPSTITPTIETAGKTIAGTFLDLLQRPDLLADAKSEFDRRVDVEPMPPLLPEDFEAPTDLPWPDYTWNGSRVW